MQDVFAAIACALSLNKDVRIYYVRNNLEGRRDAVTLHVLLQVMAYWQNPRGIVGDFPDGFLHFGGHHRVVLRLVNRPMLRQHVGEVVSFFPIVGDSSDRQCDVLMHQIGDEKVLFNIF